MWLGMSVCEYEHLRVCVCESYVQLDSGAVLPLRSDQTSAPPGYLKANFFNSDRGIFDQCQP